MAHNEKHRQKALQKQASKRKERQTATRRQPVVTRRRAALLEAADWPLLECLITEDWREPGEIVQIIVARDGGDGQIAFASFLVDLGCLGVKDAMVGMHPTEAYTFLRDQMGAIQPMVETTPDLAARVLREAIDYARSLGFEPHRDYADAALLLRGANPDAVDEPVPTGQDGKPFYVAGPHDPVDRILRQLDRAVGPGNYDFLAPISEEDLADALPDLVIPSGQPGALLPPGMDRRAMERHFWNLERLFEREQIDTEEAIQARVETLQTSGQPIPEYPPATPLEQAQLTMYDAWAAQGEERVRLARRALEMSPDCADAYVLLAEETATSPEAARALYEPGVAAGERALGPDAFDDPDYPFWGVVSSRPYMRARFGLAQALAALGHHDEAIAHYQALLDLNPNDNQGVRSRLLPLLLATGGRLGEARRLVDQYPDDLLAGTAYCRALLTFLEQGDTPAARNALREAREQNPHVVAYLLGQRPPPAQQPAAFTPGDEAEGALVASEIARAWQAYPEALAWLARQRR